MIDTNGSPAPPTRRTGFSLASALLLTTVVAVYVAGMQMGVVSKRTLEAETVAACGFLGLLIGLIVGLVIGLRQPRRGRGAVVGLVAGAVFGPPSFILLAIPDSLLVILVGSIILVAYAAIVRHFSADSAEQ